MSSITARSNHGPWQALITTFHGLVTRSWPAQPKGKHRLLCSCIKLMGVTSLGRRTRPVCNQGLLESPLNKKIWFLTSIQCVFIDFRFHRHVTSGDVITPPSPCEGSGNKFWGSCLRTRIYPTPCFFESIAPMRGDWGAVWGSRTHKLTPCTYVPSYECVCSLLI